MRSVSAAGQACVSKEQRKNAAPRETHIPAVEWVKNVFTRRTLSGGTPR